MAISASVEEEHSKSAGRRVDVTQQRSDEGVHRYYKDKKRGEEQGRKCGVEGFLREQSGWA